MKLNRTLILLTGLTLFLSACNKDEDEAVSVISVADGNPLLAYVPADTPYVAADLETIPQDISDAYLTRFQPVLDTLNEQRAEFKQDYESGELGDDASFKLGNAILDELNGEVSEENFARLGLSLQAHRVMYGMGMFPVMRVELSDADALRAAVERIEAKMGVSMPQSELNGKPYWMITDEDAKGGAIYIAILDNQLAVSAFPISAEADLLTAFLGESMPAKSIASSNALGIMNQGKGYTNYGSGYADLQMIADQVLDTNSFTRSHIANSTDIETSSFDAVCIAEFKSIVAKAPRMTVGMTTLKDDEMVLRYDLEVENKLAAGLAALVSNTPVAEEGDHLFSASLAIQVGKLRNFLIEKAKEVVASPYQCDELQNLNEGAMKLVAWLNIPMPPMINNLMGFRLKVDDIDPTKDYSDASGLLALYVDKPEMFVGMASMILPGFEELDLANQKQPVKIPSSLTRVEGVNVYALMSDNAIGAVIGEQDPADLPPFLKAKPQNSGTVFSLSVDMAKQAKIEEAMPDQWNQDDFDMGDMGDMGDMDEEASKVIEFSNAMKTSYANMLGRSRLDVNLNKDGMSIENRMTFK